MRKEVKPREFVKRRAARTAAPLDQKPLMTDLTPGDRAWVQS